MGHRGTLQHRRLLISTQQEPLRVLHFQPPLRLIRSSTNGGARGAATGVRIVGSGSRKWRKTRWPASPSSSASSWDTHLVAVQDLGDASVGDPQLAGDDAGTHPGGSHLDDLQADVAGQGAAVDEDAAQLIHTSLAGGGHVTWRGGREGEQVKKVLRDRGRVVVQGGRGGGGGQKLLLVLRPFHANSSLPFRITGGRGP